MYGRKKIWKFYQKLYVARIDANQHLCANIHTGLGMKGKHDNHAWLFRMP
jgi:hypothetical protein